MVTTLAGCGYEHTADWPGVRASGWTWGSTTSYRQVAWNANETSGSAPGFSVRLPDGRVLRPSRLTVRKLVELGSPQENLDWDSGSRFFFRYPKGQLTVLFNEFDQLRLIETMGWTHDKGAGRDVAIGNRAGTRLVELPATRDELVAIFGKPTSESSRKFKMPKCLPGLAGGC